MSRVAYVSGRYRPQREAAVHIEDRGYQFGDGVYEVITVMGGHLVDEERHLARLNRSLTELRINPPMCNAALKIVSHLFVLVFALVFVWWGIKFVQFGWYQESELAELPMPFIFIAWPLTGATWLTFLGEIFYDNLRVLFGRDAP